MFIFNIDVYIVYRHLYIVRDKKQIAPFVEKNAFFV